MTEDETNCQRLSKLEAELKAERELRLALRDLFDERDKANKEAIKAAFASAEKANDKTDQGLKEYKLASNEWRATVNDLVTRISAKGEGLHQGWAFLLGLVGLAGTITAIVLAFRK